ncbi:MAG TPA: vitamin K epoxide reductase family protein [Candidatus Nanoarchaeia archaeon]|nr:vitamin K epoxide reductase family protein [Candidatus Nanoarchaeia archaeon]
MSPVYLIILSIIGFAVSFYIYYSKKYNKPLYCPIGENCDDVIKSKYGKTFGIENSIPGMGFYFIIVIYAVGLLSNRNIFKEIVIYYSLVGISLVSVLFSLYLTYIQKFVLRKWCYYCIISTISSILIFVVIIYG